VSVRPGSQPVTKAEYARSELARRIVSGDLRPGDRLPLRPLAKDLGLSVMPVRDALPALEAEGLVTFDEKGAMVSEISRESVSDAVSARMWIEILALKDAVPKLGPAELRKAKGAMAAGASAMEEGDGEKFSELNRRFHRTLEAPAGELVGSSIEDLWNGHWRARRDLGIFVEQPDFMRDAQKEHEALYAAAAEGDADLAAKIMYKHRFRALAEWSTLLAAQESG
jgi:DNA-binding GntR family transcriptional regulator